MVGTKNAIAKLKRHPLARAVRIDKLRLAALEASLNIASTPVHDYLHANSDQLKARAVAIAAEVGGSVVPHDGRVGGGGAPGFPLPGWAVALDQSLAAPLRAGTPVVLGRVHENELLIDLRCVPPERDHEIAAAIRAAQGKD